MEPRRRRRDTAYLARARHRLRRLQPPGAWLPAGQIKSFEDLPEGDYRRQSPRFQCENFDRNLELVERVNEIAAKNDVTPGQLALAWLLHRDDDIVPIPGTKRCEYLEENVAATNIELTDEDLRRIEEVAPKDVAAGERYADMSSVNR